MEHCETSLSRDYRYALTKPSDARAPLLALWMNREEINRGALCEQVLVLYPRGQDDITPFHLMHYSSQSALRMLQILVDLTASSFPPTSLSYSTRHNQHDNVNKDDDINAVDITLFENTHNAKTAAIL